MICRLLGREWCRLLPGDLNQAEVFYSPRPGGRSSDRHNQRGAAAVEFALVFPLLFLFVYGIVNWGMILSLQNSMHYAAQAGARAALAADPRHEDYAEVLAALARQSAGVSLETAWQQWPAAWSELVLGSDYQQVEVVLSTDAAESDWLLVRLTWPDYPQNALLPLLQFGDWTIPPVPDQLTAQISLRL
ncbi:TadE/TadG family type IV pilus assembly protein [Desulfurivibrio alkaliphilus]|uniref:TadE family protein n=1 Tax=Desulfurivibrio alkaliphilus (strain DSM 19089 / UNIQEM U267 / AHT2) TaxID=589865 RepID=D6Z1Q5_DESAT|nr:TadE family protein [Desulfurivibrio alkaliphilus]ADH85480.1 TadE family protein [Desulfurivibrio alkaliphilus AHT 2]